MCTVQNNNNITKTKLQEFINDNYKKLNMSEEDKEKIIKYIKLRKCKKEIVKIVYFQLCKILEQGPSEKGKHFTYEDRVVLEVLFNAGTPNPIIGIILNKHRSNVGRELEKGKIETEDLKSTTSYKKENAYKTIVTYSAAKAQDVHLSNKAKSRKKYIFEKDPNLLAITTKLIKGDVDEETGVKIVYAPETISALLRQGKVKGTKSYISKSAIYTSVNTRMFDIKTTDLPHGRKYYKKVKTHAQYKKHTSEEKKNHSIDNMPEEVKNKESITHFEGDSVVGKREGTKNTLITLVNTKSKFLIISRAENKTAQAFVDVLDKLEKEMPEFRKIMETLLLDNGVEFSDIEGIESSCINDNEKRLKVYYAHPYTSCERGCNENKNRDIRKDFKKGENIESLSDEDILNIARRINNTPRKILGWKTALEVFEEQLISMNIDTKFLDKYRIGKSKLLVA